MIRTLWVALIGALVTAVLAAQIVIADRLGRRFALARYCWRNPRWSAQTILWAAGVEVEVQGVERLHGEGPRVLAANHESWFDVMALCAHLPVGYRFVIKKELEKVPIWGRAWRACGHVSVDRRNRQAALESLERARELGGAGGAGAGMLMVVFPEGSRSPDGAMLPFKKGAFVLALQLGAQVIPVAVIGGRQVMRKHSWRIRSGPMRVVVGEPIPVAGLSHGDRNELTRRSRAAIATLRGGEGPTEAPGARGRRI